MTRQYSKALLFIICLSIIVSNCSSPLDPSSIGQPAPPQIITITDTVVDTLIINGSDTLIDTLIQTYTDTVWVVDTLVIDGTDTLIDTVYQTDTTFVVDTLIDTIYVDVVDSTSSEEFCGRVERCKEKLHWQFSNNAGHYRVKFTAKQCDKLYPKALIAVVDGTEYNWNPGKSNVLTVEAELPADVLVSVGWPKWISWGDAVCVCVSITPLDH